MKQQQLRRSKKRKTVLIRKQFCCWCKKEVPETEAWTGDISGAIAVASISRSTPQKALALCLSCGSEGLRDKLKGLNDSNPQLRLTHPKLLMFEDRSQPIPNLEKCISFYWKCHAAEEPRQLADLLLEFERGHPTEWAYSGWKDEYVAWLVMGQAGGTDLEAKEACNYWVAEHWKNKPRVRDESAEHARAYYAAIELSSLSSRNVKRKATTKPHLGGEMFWQSLIDAFHSAFEKFDSRDLRLPDSPSPATYGQYALFVKWLTKRLARNDLKSHCEIGSRDFYCDAVHQFRRERPNCKLSNEVLTKLLAAYTVCYKQMVKRSDSIGRQWQENTPSYRSRVKKLRHAIDPSKVVLRFVADKFSVSPQLVAKVRAALNKNLRS